MEPIAEKDDCVVGALTKKWAKPYGLINSEDLRQSLYEKLLEGRKNGKINGDVAVTYNQLNTYCRNLYRHESLVAGKVSGGLPAAREKRRRLRKHTTHHEWLDLFEEDHE